MSGANDNVRYYFSGNLLQDDGLAISNKFSRLTVRSNTEFIHLFQGEHQLPGLV